MRAVRLYVRVQPPIPTPQTHQQKKARPPYMADGPVSQLRVGVLFNHNFLKVYRTCVVEPDEVNPAWL